MVSLLNGLSAMGAGIASFAGTAGLEQQRADLQRQSAILANDLAHQSRLSEIGLQQAGAESIEAMRSGSARDVEAARAASAQSVANTEAASRMAVTRETINKPPPEILIADWLRKATPEQVKAFRLGVTTKLGIPEWMTGAGEDTTPQTTGGPPNATTGAAPEGAPTATEPGAAVSGKSAADTSMPPPLSGSQGAFNERALDNVPAGVRNAVKQMVAGKMQYPGQSALRQVNSPSFAMLQLAMKYDPTFDEAGWESRVKTVKDMSPGGVAGQTITAANKALVHATTLSNAFDKLGNTSFTPANAFWNELSRTFGDARITNAEQAVDALSAEARKVFAASGGGSLEELRDWRRNFPINGSKEQQQGALATFADLLYGQIQSTSYTVDRGMQRQTRTDPLTLLDTEARASYNKLVGAQPDSGDSQKGGANAPATARSAAPEMTPTQMYGGAPAKPATAAATSPPAPADPTAREKGKSYTLPNKRIGVWMGDGWTLLR